MLPEPAPDRRLVAVTLPLRTLSTYTTFLSSFTEESAKQPRKSRKATCSASESEDFIKERAEEPK